MAELVVDLVAFIGAPAVLGAWAFIGRNWPDIRKYLESGTVGDVIPRGITPGVGVTPGSVAGGIAPSGELVLVGDEEEGKGVTPYPAGSSLYSLNAVDGLLVGSSTAGLLLFMVPQTRWVGLTTLLGSFFVANSRDNAKLIGTASAALALTATNPIAAASAGLGFLGAAASATANSMGAAIQLSTTVVGVLVTTSGAVVGYLVTRKRKRK